MRDDLESYRAALTWLIERGRAIEASEIACGVDHSSGSIRGHAAEGLRWYEQILNLPSLSPAVESESPHRSGSDVVHAGRTRTRTHRARARTRARMQRRRHGLMARADNLLGHVEHAVGNPDAARDQFTRSVEAFRTLAIPWGLGNALTGLAAVALTTGDVAQAECLLDEATSALRHAAPWFVTWALYDRAILAVRRGNADEAIAVVRESLTHIRRAPGQVRVRIRSRSSRRCSGTQRRRRVGGADPGRAGRRHRPHRRHGCRSDRCTTSGNRRNERCALALARIGGRGRMRQGARPRSIR